MMYGIVHSLMGQTMIGGMCVMLILCCRISEKNIDNILGCEFTDVAGATKSDYCPVNYIEIYCIFNQKDLNFNSYRTELTTFIHKLVFGIIRHVS